MRALINSVIGSIHLMHKIPADSSELELAASYLHINGSPLNYEKHNEMGKMWEMWLRNLSIAAHMANCGYRMRMLNSNTQKKEINQAVCHCLRFSIFTPLHDLTVTFCRFSSVFLSRNSLSKPLKKLKKCVGVCVFKWKHSSYSHVRSRLCLIRSMLFILLSVSLYTSFCIRTHTHIYIHIHKPCNSCKTKEKKRLSA